MGFALGCLAKYVESLLPGAVQTLGLIHRQGWRLTPFSRKEASLLRDALLIASQALRIDSVVRIRFFARS